ncbi:dual specificity protein phosphatase PHS1 [Physcomitrium patens]|uniref:Uncharacterized protein n=1 Tax=Physcomitrium patens TaxID=3218 RepID=A0A2K1K1H8_PHYPA|nr:dual specificity protein phosphatase PHS1-like isoform X1 [Physcomitrium patens]XP_024385432.1 dual specificity protein phosphatase PHS1-like isoform X1 [Physcomitrium patens]XP_024385433.1 dual specificity protein phosphatase PHS1-like isoform X1 [Physcomitrium patens]PNR47634.1 hypothetical protein PHYPA_012107 [Physcomitrium patens]|eukprot:XP_024385430.1 dual specificity protein phosphatase PHS1-like isoform X1 [Physcomitrella patens]
MASMLYRQESEVANELKLALEEACLELGVSLSNAFSPSALWLFDANNGDPALADLASWVNITRRRSYRPSPLNKYRKYSLPSLDDAETSEKELEERVEDDKVEILSDGEGSDIQALPEMRLKERLSNAAELDVLAKDLDWSNLLSVHRTEHAQSEDDESSDGRDSIGSIEMTVNSGGVVYFAMFRKNHVESGNDDSEENENIKYEAAAVFKFGSSRLATQSERLGIEIARHLGVATPQARVIHNNSSEWMQIQDAVVAVRETDKANENVIGLQTCEELLEALHLSRCMLIMGYIRGKPLAESKQAFASEKVAVKTAIALGRTLVLDMVLRNEDRLVCHTLGWRGNSGNLLVTEEVPHGLDQLGPPVLDSKQISGGSGFTRQRRTQSLAALSTSSNTDILVQLPKMHRSPSPELSHAGTAQSHALQNLLVPEESEALASKMGELKMKDKKEEPSCLLVAIDSGVSRRPPGMKIEHDRRIYSKTIELLLHDEETAGNLLREISFGYLGPPFENEKTSEADFSGEPATPPEEFDHHKIIRAFQRGVIVGIRDMQVLRMFMVKLFRTLDQLLREFMAYVSNLPDEEGSKTETEVTKPPVEETQPSDVKVSPENGTPQKPSGSTSMMSSEQQESPQSLPSGPVSTPIREKSPRVSMLKISPSSLRKSPVSSPRLNSPNKISPVRESWHKKGSPGRMTFKLKDVSKTAKIDCEWSKKLEWWDEKMRSEGQKLCKDHKFTTGFLEGGGSHSVVDSYELKVRLEHILERMIMISNGSDTEKPSCVLSPSLYIGSALAARSVNTLQHLRITHVLCLCPSDLEDANVGDFPELFTYKHLEVKDVEDENIAAHFEEACSFIAQAEGDNKTILVHCFEGKSRSATMVLAYLMLRKGHTLAQAWSILKTAHRRTQPNDGFMKTLVELDKKLHGKASMTFLKRRPAGQRCPICDKVAGFSIVALQQHIRRVHPGIPLHSQSAPIV